MEHLNWYDASTPSEVFLPAKISYTTDERPRNATHEPTGIAAASTTKKSGEPCTIDVRKGNTQLFNEFLFSIVKKVSPRIFEEKNSDLLKISKLLQLCFWRIICFRKYN